MRFVVRLIDDDNEYQDAISYAVTGSVLASNRYKQRRDPMRGCGVAKNLRSLKIEVSRMSENSVRDTIFLEELGRQRKSS